MRARGIIERGEGQALLIAMLEQMRHGVSEEDAIKRTMAILEAIARVDFVVAGYLMTRLCYPAGERYMHDVCDAVDLWIDANASPELAALLRKDLAAEGDDTMRSRYDEWLSRLVSKS